MIPAVATQLYMAFFSEELFDNGFNISHVMTSFAYFIPFIGLSLNYLQTHKNERLVIVKLNHEMRELAIAEDTLSGVLNSSLSSIMAFRAVRKGNAIVDFTWQLTNPATGQLFKTDHTKLAGKSLLREFPFAADEGWLELFKTLVNTGEPLNHEYFSDHFQKWFQMAGVKLEDGLAVTISDISRRKNALQKLMNTEKLAMTGRLARTIAHEVRNPLTNINLSLEHLGWNAAEGQEKYFEMIRRNSERINQLITEMMNSSRPAELVMTDIPVDVLLDQTLDLAKDRIVLKDIKLIKNYGREKIVIRIDSGKMKIALLNLLINAVEAMEAGKGILELATYIEKGRCVITITDNGYGIDKEHLEHLFEPFFSKKSKGMGLGLTATQNIIFTHEGTIDVQSEPGKGTMFIVSFPL